MRALGPGSVSSILKVILDVAFHALWVLAVLLAIASVFAIAIAVFPSLARDLAAGSTARIQISPNAPSAAFEASTATLYTLGVIVIVGRLRRLFASLSAGDPFHPDNVRRLRTIALMLAALEIGRYVAAAIVAMGRLSQVDVQRFSLTPWFAVLVVLVLAEVFREGARLRREAELTI
jgi:hypothetical protein